MRNFFSAAEIEDETRMLQSATSWKGA